MSRQMVTRSLGRETVKRLIIASLTQPVISSVVNHCNRNEIVALVVVLKGACEKRSLRLMRSRK